MSGQVALEGGEIIFSGDSTTTFTFVGSGKVWNEDKARRRSACKAIGAGEGVLGMSGDHVVQAGMDRGTLRVCDLQAFAV